MQRISVSIPDRLDRRLDQAIEELGCYNKPEMIRYAILEWLDDFNHPGPVPPARQPNQPTTTLTKKPTTASNLPKAPSKTRANLVGRNTTSSSPTIKAAPAKLKKPALAKTQLTVK